MKNTPILLLLFFGFVQQSHAQNIYGFAGQYFVSFNPYTDEADTLIEFSGNPYINGGFRSAIDRYNGRYFFGGNIPGLEGKFHIIDLITLEITSFPVYPENIEYDYIRDKIVYEKNGSFFSLDLATMELTALAFIEDGNSVKYGQIRTYVALRNQYVYADFPGFDEDELHYLVIDAATGALVCQEQVDEVNGHPYSAKGLVTNHHTGEIIGHHEATYGFLDPCEPHMTRLSDIPGYYAHLNTQLCVFDHQHYNYVVPFVTGGDDYTNYYAIIAPYQDLVLDIKLHPFDGRMNLHQIYDQPLTDLIMFNDTLFVPRGLQYTWYKDGQQIGVTYGVENYWIPSESGRYTAEVVFREYASMSPGIDITTTSLDQTVGEGLLKMYPNPVTDDLTIENYDGNINAVQVVDIEGREVYSSGQKEELPGSVLIDMVGLAQGIYIVNIYCKNGYYSRQVVKM